MRVLLLLRGSAGCGKSTWIKENGLENYTLSSDNIRMMYSSTSLSAYGEPIISQDQDKFVWQTLFKILEARMQNGEFTVIDATNTKTSEMQKYKEIAASYKYRIYCVDFTNIPIEVTKERNKKRPKYKQVPERAIEKMYARFQTQKIPSGITVIKPDELDKIWLKKIDLSGYKKVHHIGDIHGCYTALSNYFKQCGGMKDDEFYIFCGDYVDRGVENAEVVKFLLEIYEKKNVLLLEGNHERWLWLWANGGVGFSREFENHTKQQLEAANISKKAVRQLYRRIGQCAYYSCGDNTYLVTHAGLSNIPEPLTKVSARQMIRGVGRYNDYELVAESFVKNTPDNYYQIFGHRNTKRLPTKISERVFDLEGQVEYGGCLRCVQVSPTGEQEVFEVQNTVFKAEKHKAYIASDIDNASVSDIITMLRENSYVQEKRFGNISSFNFTKTAFYDKIWDEQTMKARGLYINTQTQKIVARAYNKFFNINERPETKFDMLQYKLKFPVKAYVKENGFLGIVSYNEDTDSLFITTKSSPDGDFAGYLKENLYVTYSEEVLERLKCYCKDNNVSFVFECVDMKNDPHIIEYEKNKLFLLDIVYNEVAFRKYPYEEMCNVADMFGMQHKELAYTIDSWQDFFDWYYVVKDDEYQYYDKYIEGFVLEDANGYMVKVKLAYYNFWKFMRSIAQETIKRGYIDGKKTSALTTALSNHFYNWAKGLHDASDVDKLPKDICALRKLFLNSEEGMKFNGATLC